MSELYILIDPFTNECRYIGKAVNAHKRYIRHIWEAKQKGAKKHLYCWIKSLLNKNSKPEILIIDEVEDWQYWERFYIEYFKSIGCNLTNIAEGGRGSTGCNHTDERKLYLSNLFKGRKPWNTGKKLSEEHREAIAQGNKGKEFSEEAKKKIGKANAKAHRKKSKFTEKDIEYIKSKPMTQQKLADKYGVSQSHISRIQKGEVWDI
jgi:group I intron endonuclease